jgi:hypothetical protein
MPSKRITAVLFLVTMIMSGYSTAHAADLFTLFTTPQERQIINSNRYKTTESQPVQEAVSEPEIELVTQLQAHEEVTYQYQISGITVSREGPSTVWINSLAYEDGELLEDSSKIRVMTGDEVRVRITAPDGKNYYATSGETLDVTYSAPVEN